MIEYLSFIAVNAQVSMWKFLCALYKFSFLRSILSVPFCSQNRRVGMLSLVTRPSTDKAGYRTLTIAVTYSIYTFNGGYCLLRISCLSALFCAY